MPARRKRWAAVIVALPLMGMNIAHTQALPLPTQQPSLWEGINFAYTSGGDLAECGATTALDGKPGIRIIDISSSRAARLAALPEHLPDIETLERVISPAQPNHYLILISFDGTGNYPDIIHVKNNATINIRYPEKCAGYLESESDRKFGFQINALETNPRLLFDQVVTAGYDHAKVIYHAGVGTGIQYAPKELRHIINIVQQGVGFGMESAVEENMEEMWSGINEIRRINNSAVIYIVTTGFSRGAASARLFNHQFYVEKRKEEAKYRGINIYASILYDTVSTQYPKFDHLALKNFDTPKEIRRVYHFVAENEYRPTFRGHPAKKRADGSCAKNVTEISIPGAHADIGGGYDMHGISSVTLALGVDILKAIGVPVNPNYAEKNKPEKSRFVIHASDSQDGKIEDPSFTQLRSMIYSAAPCRAVPFDQNPI